ncbi:MAG: SIS domain-containing protein [Ruminococcaceae bacterium]|nr:SIS domain-containing protein [Oscillospiraceae bacterium]
MTYLDILQDLFSRYPTLAAVRQDVIAAYTAMKQCFAEGGKVLTAGNGGSAADAEHIAGELMKCFAKKRPLSPEHRAALIAADPQRGQALADMLQETLPIISLTGHAALSTAVMNDSDAVAVFAQQVWGWGKPGDILLAISTSGNAENLLLATAAAKARGMKVILLTGATGGKLAPLADIAMRVPEQETYLVQELHLPLYHALCRMLENEFFAV